MLDSITPSKATSEFSLFGSETSPSQDYCPSYTSHIPTNFPSILAYLPSHEQRKSSKMEYWSKAIVIAVVATILGDAFLRWLSN